MEPKIYYKAQLIRTTKDFLPTKFSLEDYICQSIMSKSNYQEVFKDYMDGRLLEVLQEVDYKFCNLDPDQIKLYSVPRYSLNHFQEISKEEFFDTNLIRDCPIRFT